MKKTEAWKEFVKRKEKQFQKEKDAKKQLKMKDIDRKGSHYWFREAWTFMKQSNYDQKVFVVERLKKVKTSGKVKPKGSGSGEIEYRIGYYVVNRRSLWWWGQFCPLIPASDLKKLIKKAEDNGTIL